MATDFKSLDETRPLGTEGAGGGNEELQALKQALKSVFPDNGGVGQWDGDLFLGPDGAGTPTGNASVGGLSVETDATIKGRIEANAQVPIANVKFDGTGTTLGTLEGVVSVVRQSAGTYRVTLVETGWNFNDLTVIGSVDNAIAGLGICQARQVNSSSFDLITVIATAPATPADCATCEIAVFDRGRD